MGGKDAKVVGEEDSSEVAENDKQTQHRVKDQAWPRRDLFRQKKFEHVYQLEVGD